MVDLQFQDEHGARHQISYGGDYYDWGTGLILEGGFWHNLNDQQINVVRESSDSYISKVRVRIWVYR